MAIDVPVHISEVAVERLDMMLTDLILPLPPSSLN